MTRAKGTTEAYVAAAAKSVASERYDLCLYVAGTTPLSVAAVANVAALCEERLKGRYDLRVVDVYKHPERARDDQIIAVPTLLKRSPGRRRCLIGDLSNRTLVLSGLDLPADDS